MRGQGSQTSNHFGAVTHSSGGFRIIQGDSIRNIYAQFPIDDDAMSFVSGALRGNGGRIRWDADSSHSGEYLAIQGNFQASYIVPTANENRPINTAVRYLIRAR